MTVAADTPIVKCVFLLIATALGDDQINKELRGLVPRVIAMSSKSAAFSLLLIIVFRNDNLDEKSEGGHENVNHRSDMFVG